MGTAYVRCIEARVIVGVGSREAKQFVRGGDPIAISANLDLLTGGVELCFAFRRRQMQGDDLVPDEILSWGEIIRKSSVENGPVHCVRA